MQTEKNNSCSKKKIEKFPERFFENLTNEEIKLLQSTFFNFKTFFNEIFYEGQIMMHNLYYLMFLTRQIKVS